eukprot:1286118-Pyramimonas_sp.AAC.2
MPSPLTRLVGDLVQGYYPPNTLVFSYCDDLSTQCAKYKDWRGNCPKDTPRYSSPPVSLKPY